MKKVILFISVFVGLTNLSFAQEDPDREAHWERIKALKVAFFTQEMNFSDKVAEKFWPIYNKYEKERGELFKREHADINVECLNENQANEYLSEFLSVENEEYRIKKQLFKDLREFMSAKEILKIYKLEDEFHRKLFKEYRSKKGGKNNNSSE
ncbi:hypothetical protein C7S20_16210 [Christiangramia fulva]|uniref:Sensor of ECF-type sigma factor n=1 Tax=Christiangramia fulva TaxID=2126553 RepID=A0A2R3Z8T8_9FLAO|nr:hypothetical protein [Christiangramia fulva]AVR46686.1 hypothetical protein C7S20_16210 [Christiangramia fulva]